MLHFIVAILLVGTILLQAGKGTDIGAAFGAGSSQTLFGARGAATFLSKLTTGIAIVFLLTSLSLATISKYIANGSAGTSVIEEKLKDVQKTPETPVDNSVLPGIQTEETEDE